MSLWNDALLTANAADSISATVTAEQFFVTRPIFSASQMANPRKFRTRLHLSLSTAALSAGSLRLRMILGTGIVGGVVQNPTVIGDSAAFNLTGNLLGMTAAQIYIHHSARLKAVGTAGNSLINGQAVGQILPASGLPILGITMPLTADLTTMDCTIPQTLYIGAAFGAVSASNVLTLTGIASQFTD